MMVTLMTNTKMTIIMGLTIMTKKRTIPVVTGFHKGFVGEVLLSNRFRLCNHRQPRRYEE